MNEKAPWLSSCAALDKLRDSQHGPMAFLSLPDDVICFAHHFSYRKTCTIPGNRIIITAEKIRIMKNGNAAAATRNMF